MTEEQIWDSECARDSYEALVEVRNRIAKNNSDMIVVDGICSKFLALLDAEIERLDVLFEFSSNEFWLRDPELVNQLPIWKEEGA